MRAYIALGMALLMTNIPHLAAAEVLSESMIPTSVVVEDLHRAQTQAKIESILSSDDVRTRLADLGLTQDEISRRLALLSDSELRQMAADLDEARYGGDGVTGILVIVVLVLLIIFLAKRI